MGGGQDARNNPTRPTIFLFLYIQVSSRLSTSAVEKVDRGLCIKYLRRSDSKLHEYGLENIAIRSREEHE